MLSKWWAMITPSVALALPLFLQYLSAVYVPIASPFHL